MPPKVLPTKESFEEIESRLLARGFKKSHKGQFWKDLKAFKIIPPPRHQVGSETGFENAVNGYTIRCWTTWVEAQNAARETDVGWWLILENGNPLHYARVVRRTKEFVENFLHRGWKTWCHIKKLPKCKVCGEPTKIVHRYPDHSKPYTYRCIFYRCFNTSKHPGGGYRDTQWYDVLPPETKKKAVEMMRQAKRQRNKTKKEKKKDPTPEFLKRQGWKRSSVSDADQGNYFW